MNHSDKDTYKIFDSGSITEERLRQNLICNFRAPDQDAFLIWQQFKQWAVDHGLDVCYLTLSLCQGFLKSVHNVDEPTLIPTGTKIIQIQQANTFVYGVEKPRREPVNLNCSQAAFSRTITRAAWESYIVEKGRDLERSFSYRDFMEIGHSTFRKSIVRLRKNRKIKALEPRTNPRFYAVIVSENNRVKPRFTAVSGSDVLKRVDLESLRLLSLSPDISSIKSTPSPISSIESTPTPSPSPLDLQPDSMLDLEVEWIRAQLQPHVDELKKTKPTPEWRDLTKTRFNRERIEKLLPKAIRLVRRSRDQDLERLVFEARELLRV